MTLKFYFPMDVKESEELYEEMIKIETDTVITNTPIELEEYLQKLEHEEKKTKKVKKAEKAVKSPGLPDGNNNVGRRSGLRAKKAKSYVEEEGSDDDNAVAADSE